MAAIDSAAGGNRSRLGAALMISVALGAAPNLRAEPAKDPATWPRTHCSRTTELAPYSVERASDGNYRAIIIVRLAVNSQPSPGEITIGSVQSRSATCTVVLPGDMHYWQLLPIVVQQSDCHDLKYLIAVRPNYPLGPTPGNYEYLDDASFTFEMTPNANYRCNSAHIEYKLGLRYAEGESHP
jgi:hypothetical protein